MADVQVENGFTRVANELMEKVMAQKFNGSQFKIILAIWRYTYGFSRKSHDFSLTFLSKATDIHKQQVKKELDKLIEEKVIAVVENSTFTKSRKLAFNKDYSQWFNSQSVEEHTVSQLAYPTVSELTDTTVSQLAYQERNIKESIKENSVTTIFNHYISKDIINHKKITSSIKSAINTRLKDYTIEEVIKALDNYEIVLSGEQYWFNHKYPLADFMRDKDIRKFLEEADPLNNFLKDKNKSPKTKTEKPKEYKSDSIEDDEFTSLL